jgi:RND superfamily putative drug exporter
LKKLARAAVERPKLGLAAWLAAISLLAFAGLGVEDRLHRTALIVDGTAAAEATDVFRERFGESVTLAVMLEGPRRELEREGPRIAKRLDALPHTAVLTPWMEGSGEGLRPDPERALVILRGDQGFEAVSRDVVPEAREILDEDVSPPLEARMTGTPDIAAGVHGDTVAALRQAELIAAPLLLLVLLLVFRSPVAAAIPLVLGVATVAAGNGVLSLVNEVKPLDAAALNMGSMMGLALGVDYSLLLVSRFREELARGLSGKEAALVAVRTAGRTVVFAGLALAAAMAVAAMVAPGDLLASASIGATTAAVLGMLGGAIAVPAALTLLGPQVNRWSFGSPGGDSRFAGWALRALRRPALAAAAVTALVLALAVPAAGLETGPPDPRVLSESSPERNDYEAIADALGPGWSAPYEIVVAPESGTVTGPARLRALADWERRLARKRGVSAVYGPGPVARGAERIDRAAGELQRAGRELERGRRQGRRLTSALDRAGDGVGDLRAGLITAADAAGRLETGAGDSVEGTAELVAGLGRALDGAARLDAGLASGQAGMEELAAAVDRADSGAERLRDGLADARSGIEESAPQVERLAAGLDRGAQDLERLREPAQTTEAELSRAKAALERMSPTSKAEPEYRTAYEAVATALAATSGRDPFTGEPVRPGYEGLDASLAQAASGVREAEAGVNAIIARSGELADGLARLEQGAQELAGGMERLDAGAARLVEGIAELGAGGTSLTDGLTRLEAGGGELAEGVGRLRAGAGELESGLASGTRRTGRLQSGMGRLEAGAARASERTAKLDGSVRDPEELAEPLESGYFVLAALDSGERDVRTGSSFTVNVDEGGTAARISVVSKDDPKRTGHPLRDVLEGEADRFQLATGMPAEVGGGAAILQDFNGAAAGRMGLLVLLLCAVTWVVLVPVLRSLLLPLLAVVLNLLTVAAAFGVLVLLFQGDAPLGGAGFLDAIMVAGIFSVVFALSIDYEVFLLARMREGWLITGTTEGAVEYGLRKTAGVVTGAAAIMLGVFVVFSFADIASMRQLGIGLSIAVLLDATIVRLILLPAAIRLCGDRCWRLPAWLERRLPDLDIEGESQSRRPRPQGRTRPAALASD